MLARVVFGGKATDFITCTAPLNTSSTLACFGVMLGAEDCDFGKYGSLSNGDVSILAAEVTYQGTSRDRRKERRMIIPGF